MTFVKGRSGNPLGRNAPGDKPWADALRVAAHRADKLGKRGLQRLAEKTWQMALAGDMQAIKEIGDRLDGKPIQASNVTINRTTDQFSDDEINARLADLRERATIDLNPVGQRREPMKLASDFG